MPSAEILSQGDEIITGQTVDTNAAWLATRLTDLGFGLRAHSSVGDDAEHIRDVVGWACRRSDLVVCSGGLGPTEDDLTAEAVAAAAGVPLVLDEQALAGIERIYRRFGKPMADSNRKQAWLPQGCQRLDNRWGTAPGFALSLGHAWLVCVPGVPREMRKLFEHRVSPELERRFTLRPGRLVTLRTAGIGESRLQQLIGHWRHPGVTLSYRTMPPENQVKLRFAAGIPDEQAQQLADELATTIGESVFAREGAGGPEGDLPSVTIAALRRRGLGLAVDERGSGGRLVAMLLAAEGADAVMRRSSVSPAAAGEDGAVETMAARVREHSAADLGLALVLESEPGAENAGAGEVALVGADLRLRRPFRVVGGRDLIRTLGAGAAIDFLRRQRVSGLQS